MCGIVELVAPVFGAPDIRLAVRVGLECVVLRDVLPLCQGHARSAPCEAHCTSNRCRLHLTSLSLCVQCPIARLMPARVVLWACVKPIALTHNVALHEMVFVEHIRRSLRCVGSILVRNEHISNTVPGVALCIVRVHVDHSMITQMGCGREPDEPRTREPEQCSLFRHSAGVDFGFKMRQSTTESTCSVLF